MSDIMESGENGFATAAGLGSSCLRRDENMWPETATGSDTAPRIPLCCGRRASGSGAERAVTVLDKAGDEHTDLVHSRGSVVMRGTSGDLRWWAWTRAKPTSSCQPLWGGSPTPEQQQGDVSLCSNSALGPRAWRRPEAAGDLGRPARGVRASSGRARSRARRGASQTPDRTHPVGSVGRWGRSLETFGGETTRLVQMCASLQGHKNRRGSSE